MKRAYLPAQLPCVDISCPVVGGSSSGPVIVDSVNKDLQVNSLPPQGTELDGGKFEIGGGGGKVKTIQPSQAGAGKVETLQYSQISSDVAPSQGSNPQLKRGRGRPAKERSKTNVGGSKNKYEVLSSIDPDVMLRMASVDSGRKQREASLGVEKLLHDLKLKKKENVSKAKKLEECGGVSSSPPVIGILCLLETRVKENNSGIILNKKFGDWDFCCNYNHATNGRIWVLWHKSISCSVISCYDHSVSIRSTFGGKSFCITAVYGFNEGSLRKHLWDHLRLMESIVGNEPWLIGGDFNVTLNSYESSIPINVATRGDISDFQNCVDVLGLSDHPFSGPLFTWSNKQQGSFLARNLDRVLINPVWFGSFADSEVEFLAPGDSDHCPAFAWLYKFAPVSRPKPFKFLNFWTLHPRFMDVVEESWQVPSSGNPAQVLFLKLKRLKRCLKDLNRSHFSDIYGLIKEKREELQKIQLANLDPGASGQDVSLELEIEKELKALEITELLFYKQKVKVNWLKEGDQGTKFFHSMVSIRRKSTTIRMRYDQNRTRLDTFEDMANEVVRFFKNQLGMADSGVIGSSVSTIRNLLGYSLPLEAVDFLCSEVSDLKIKDVIWGQGNDKSPGPDGYNPFFFKAAWSIVGEDFKNAFRFCFNESFILPSFNATAIVLVPKIPNPSSITDFRPISLCSVIYQTVTKILVNRLSIVFSGMVSFNQTAFY
ncbi:uncharacterized protein LOC120132053 [Hibiscus syriacus]|uniref:uncharacterized protein LOC120132053 n=1 Tax=Hibiscus syriacus TaxID=106335 RepID=UPI0019209F23|nr:uncharacterized protein LOC120132053 [Hibiscus syriacus]